MGTSVSSGNTSITGSVTATTTGKQLSTLGVYQAGAGTLAIATVPANHQYKIKSIHLACGLTGGAIGNTKIQVNGVDSMALHWYMGAANSDTFVADVDFGADYLLLTAGQVIQMICTTGTGSSLNDGAIFFVDEVV